MSTTLLAGEYYNLPIQRIVTVGAYLEDGADGLLLPKRYVPKGAKAGDAVDVFVYHDSDDRLIATTDKPKAIVNQFAYLTVVSLANHGAYLDWGLPKDLLVAKSQQREGMRVGGQYLVYVYRDPQSGRLAATEWYDKVIQLAAPDSYAPLAPVTAIVVRRTPLGFAVIVDHLYEGLIHHSDTVVDYRVGQTVSGFVKTIREDGKLDMVPGKAGYAKAGDEVERILALLRDNNGYLPYHDKSEPEAIYAFFGISKKAFKMAIGALYKQRKIELTKTGIQLLPE